MAYFHLFWDDSKNEPHITKAGFNFWAFFFGFFYFLYRSAWISAGAYFAANIFINTLQVIFDLPEGISLFTSFLLQIYIGFDASDCLVGEWHRKKYRYLTSDHFSSKELAAENAFKLSKNNSI